LTDRSTEQENCATVGCNMLVQLRSVKIPTTDDNISFNIYLRDALHSAVYAV